MNKVRNDIEYNYQNMSPEKLSNYKSNLMQLAHTFKLLNLNEAVSELSQQASSLSQINILSNENYAQVVDEKHFICHECYWYFGAPLFI